MIVDPASRVVLSSLGWVDHGSVWRFDTASGQHDAFELSDADHLKLFAGDGDRFVVQHSWGARRFRITAHLWDAPEVVVSSIDVNGWAPRLDGDGSVWATLPAAYVGALDDDATGAGGYYLLDVRDRAATVTRLDWFGDDYDHSYQGVASVVAVPESSAFLFGVARSSDLVRWEVGAADAPQRVPLAGRAGNPIPVLSARGPAVWVSDYDTVVRVDRRTWAVTASRLLQPATDGLPMFVGHVFVPADESCLLVARPGAGDVALLDPDDLTVLGVVELGREPLVAALTVGGRVVARDWKSGDMLLGRRGKARRRLLRRRTSG